MKKTTLYLVFILGLLFFYIPQLSAVEKDESSWIDFFNVLSPEEPAKIDAATNYDTGLITEKPIIKEDSSVKTAPPAPKLLHKDMVKAHPQKPVVKENNLLIPY